MNFRPNKKKVIVSVVVVVIWYAFLLYTIKIVPHCLCEPCPSSFLIDQCPEVIMIDPLPDACKCSCSCPKPTPLSNILSDLLWILFPGILVYLIWGLFESRNKGYLDLSVSQRGSKSSNKGAPKRDLGIPRVKRQDYGHINLPGYKKIDPVEKKQENLPENKPAGIFKSFFD